MFKMTIDEVLFTPVQKMVVVQLAADYEMSTSDFIRYCITEVANGAVIPTDNASCPSCGELLK
jgi:hypothetical protein